MVLDRVTHIRIWNDIVEYSTSSGRLGIASGTLNLEEILCDGELKLGSCCANKFEVELFVIKKEYQYLVTQSGKFIFTSRDEAIRISTPIEDVLPDMRGMNIEVTVTENEVTKPLFVGIIDSSITDNSGYFRNIVAYDKFFSLRDLNVGVWWDTFWERNVTVREVSEPVSPRVNGYFEKTSDGTYVLTEDNLAIVGKTYYEINYRAKTRDILQELCKNCGLEYIGLDSLVNGNVLVGKYVSSGIDGVNTTISFGELLNYLCEFNGCFANISRDGKLEILYLSSTLKQLGQFEDENIKLEDYTTKPITGVSIYESGDSLIMSTGQGTNNYNIVGNPFTFAVDNDDILRQVASNIYDTIKGINYIPSVIPMVVSDLELKLGDFVETVNSKGLNNHHYILSQILNGPCLVNQEIHSPSYGEGLNQELSDIVTNIIYEKKYSYIKKDNDLIRFGVSRELAGKADKSSLEILADRINMEFVSKDNEEFKNLTTHIQFDVNGINISSTINEGENPTNLQLSADGAHVRRKDGTQVASMEDNKFSTGKWTMVQTNDGNTFNIFKERS